MKKNTPLGMFYVSHMLHVWKFRLNVGKYNIHGASGCARVDELGCIGVFNSSRHLLGNPFR